MYSKVIQLYRYIHIYVCVYIYIFFLFQILFLFRLLQNIEYSSLCYTVDPCWLSILYIVVCTTNYKILDVRNLIGKVFRLGKIRLEFWDEMLSLMPELIPSREVSIVLLSQPTTIWHSSVYVSPIFLPLGFIHSSMHLFNHHICQALIYKTNNTILQKNETTIFLHYIQK